ncbi:hypothetical protein QR680_001180 [Steinernema hermaphroditum]|uniref:Uncharacterized protein n=1 Tax=Steinernema hermaphroditum TaxID=289476 RepID=A0AA39GX77_9BILA|nr:hypothetical protein QR680_001180 [Steinernema hermaphroditum]
MLSDIFGELGLGDEIVEAAEKKPDRNTSDQVFEAVKQNDHWFKAVSDEADWEIALAKASAAYSEGHYSEAYSYFTKALEEKNHKTSHKIGLLESKIRSAIRGKCLSDAQVKEDLSTLQSLLSTHGEQIQLWNLQNEFYASSDASDFLEHCRVVILLCATNDYSRFWKMFLNVRNGDLSNLHVFSGCRAAHLLRNEAEMCSGHLKTRCIQMAEQLEKQMIENYPQKFAEAKKEAEKRTSSRRDCPSDFLPPHACKSDAKLKNDTEQKELVAEFIRGFPWFFADWPSDLVGQLKDL